MRRGRILATLLLVTGPVIADWQPMPGATLESVMARADLDLRSVDRLPKGAAGAILHYDFVGEGERVYCVEIRGAAYRSLESRCYRRAVD